MVSTRISRAAVCAVLFFASIPPARAELISQPVRICDSGAGASIGSPGSLSADGRYAAFSSYAPNLVAGQQTDGNENVFLRDRISGTTVLVSHKAGDPLTGGSWTSTAPIVSADGNFAVFSSQAEDLVAGQAGAGTGFDLFLWERATGTITLITHTAAAASTEANGMSYPVSLSADGRYFLFNSSATDLVSGQVDTNGTTDAFLYDRVTGSTLLASHSTASATTAGSSGTDGRGLSSDGRYVVLWSSATDLVPGGASGVFFYDRVSGAVTHVAAGAIPEISADGNFIAFTSDAELVPGQTDPSSYGNDVYLYQRTTGTLTLVTHASFSALTSAQGSSDVPILSQDGRYVVYQSSSDNLVAGQTAAADTGLFLYDRTTGENRLVAHTPSSTVTPATGRSQSPVLSPDGRWIAFLSDASNLVAGQSGPEGWNNVFLYDRTTQAVTLASHVAGSAQTASDRSSDKLSLSSDGRWIAFQSDSESLSDEDCNARSDVFLYDRDGALQIVSRHHPDMPSLTGSGASLLATHAFPVSALSDDGRFAAFASGATNLVDGVTGYNSANVFLRDRQTGETVLVSASAAVPGRPANHDSLDLAVSADGRWVAFLSKATDLVPGQVDTEASNDVFLFDRVSRSVTLVSRSAASAVTAGSNASISLGLSSDGRYVVFSSRATDLVPGQADSFATEDVFVYDRLTGQTGLVSRKAGTLVEAAGSSSEPQISGDGRYVAFTSSAKTLVSGASYPFTSPNVYLQDRWADVTTLVSRTNGPTLTAGHGSSPLLSLDGRFVAYESLSSDLVPGQSDANGTWDVFLYDRVLGANSLVSHVPGTPLTTGNDLSGYPRISPEGTYLAFESWATNLVPGQTDTNADRDVFLHDSRSGENTLVSHAAGSPATAGAGYSRRAPVSADGKVVFLSRAPDLVSGQVDDTTSTDAFLYDPASGENRLLSGAGGSETVAGNSNGFGAFMVAISRNGRSAAFDTNADNLVEGDYNGVSGSDVFAVRLPDVGTDFYAIEPCRLLDTRTPEDGPALVSGRSELLAVHGACGIPDTARALALNITAIGATSGGNLRLHEGGVAAPGSSAINFAAGLTRANNAIVALTPGVKRGLTVTPFVSDGGTVHVLIDVTGYFE
jgi:Tol biopolymer transport system component